MHKIVFLDRATIAPQIRLRRARFDHEFVEYDRTLQDEVVSRLAGATIAIVNKVVLSGKNLERLPDLRLIAVAATGTDCVDKDWCKARGITVTNIRGYAVNTVPEHTFSLMLALRRNILAYREDVIAGKWQEAAQFCYFDHPIRDLAGARLGIIGGGTLGQRVAEIARGFAMVPLFAAHKGKAPKGPMQTPWQEVLETSDVLTLHAPLMPETRNMIALPEFRAMKCKPLLINTARGGLVDENDLVAALDAGLISGAGFDVAVEEPPSLDNALLRAATRRNVILTPHVAWASDEAQQTLADQLVDNIENFVAGKPSNVVGGSY